MKDFKLAQSGSISRYLARKVNMVGENFDHIAIVESIYKALVDIRTHWLKAFYAPEPDKVHNLDDCILF